MAGNFKWEPSPSWQGCPPPQLPFGTGSKPRSQHLSKPPKLNCRCRVKETAIARWSGYGGVAALNQANLCYLPPAGLLAAGWWQTDSDCTHHVAFFAPRFCVEVPDELLHNMFGRLLQDLLHGLRMVSWAARTMSHPGLQADCALPGCTKVFWGALCSGACLLVGCTEIPSHPALQ